jgi:hypothetical protein
MNPSTIERDGCVTCGSPATASANTGPHGTTESYCQRCLRLLADAMREHVAAVPDVDTPTPFVVGSGRR